MDLPINKCCQLNSVYESLFLEDLMLLGPFSPPPQSPQVAWISSKMASQTRQLFFNLDVGMWINFACRLMTSIYSDILNSSTIYTSNASNDKINGNVIFHQSPHKHVTCKIVPDFPKQQKTTRHPIHLLKNDETNQYQQLVGRHLDLKTMPWCTPTGWLMRSSSCTICQLQMKKFTFLAMIFPPLRGWWILKP